MDININKDCSCICPSELKYSCDANGLCYQNDEGEYSSVAECIQEVKLGNCGLKIRLSSNYLPLDPPNNFIVGSLTVSNLNNDGIIYTLEDSSTFVDNDYFVIEDNNLIFTGFEDIEYGITKFYNVYIKAAINENSYIYQLFTIDVVIEDDIYQTTVDAGQNVLVNTPYNLSLLFDNISTGGILLIKNYTNGLVDIFDVSTTALYSGNITICKTIPENIDINFVSISNFSGGSATNIPITSIDNETRVVCGVTQSFSSIIIDTYSNYSVSEMFLDTEDLINDISKDPDRLSIIYNNDNTISNIDRTNLTTIECTEPEIAGILDPFEPIGTEVCGCWNSFVDINNAILIAEDVLKHYSATKLNLIDLNIISDNITNLQLLLTGNLNTKKIVEPEIVLIKRKILKNQNEIIILENQIPEITNEELKNTLTLKLQQLQNDTTDLENQLVLYTELNNSTNVQIQDLDIQVNLAIQNYNEYKNIIFNRMQSLYESYSLLKNLTDFIIPDQC